MITEQKVIQRKLPGQILYLWLCGQSMSVIRVLITFMVRCCIFRNDLEPFYVAVQGNLERLIAQLAGFFLPEVVLHGQNEIEFLRQLSRKKVLQLRRMVWVAQ
jgi:hypothetical protein